MPETLIGELRQLEKVGLSRSTLASARGDRFHAWMERVPFVRQMATSHAQGFGNSATSIVDELVQANLSLDKDRRACVGEVYRQKVNAALEHLRDVIPLSGTTSLGLRYVDLTEGFDPARAWRAYAWIAGVIILVMLCAFAYVVSVLPGEPRLIPALAAGGATLVALAFLTLLPRDENKAAIRNRKAFAKQVRADAAHIDACIRDAFPPPGVSPFRRHRA